MAVVAWHANQPIAGKGHADVTVENAASFLHERETAHAHEMLSPVGIAEAVSPYSFPG